MVLRPNTAFGDIVSVMFSVFVRPTVRFYFSGFLRMVFMIFPEFTDARVAFWLVKLADVFVGLTNFDANGFCAIVWWGGCCTMSYFVGSVLLVFVKGLAGCWKLSFFS
jgi:hypothetical protein